MYLYLWICICVFVFMYLCLCIENYISAWSWMNFRWSLRATYISFLYFKKNLQCRYVGYRYVGQELKKFGIAFKLSDKCIKYIPNYTLISWGLSVQTMVVYWKILTNGENLVVVGQTLIFLNCWKLSFCSIDAGIHHKLQVYCINYLCLTFFHS